MRNVLKSINSEARIKILKSEILKIFWLRNNREWMALKVKSILQQRIVTKSIFLSNPDKFTSMHD